MLGGGVPVGVIVCVAGDERLFRGRLLNRLDHRLCLRLNNPADAIGLGFTPRNLPDGLPPGRGLWAADGCEVQVPVLTAEPGGPRQAAALAELGARLRTVHGDPVGDDAPLRLDALPSRIGAAAAGRLPVSIPEGGTERCPGRGEWRPPLLGVRPARSGGRCTPRRRPSALGPQHHDGHHRRRRGGRGRSVVLVAPRPGGPAPAAAARGVTVVDVAGLPGVLDTADVVVLDDADIAGLDEAVTTRLTGSDGPALVVAAALDSFGFGARGLVAAGTQDRGAGGVAVPAEQPRGAERRHTDRARSRLHRAARQGTAVAGRRTPARSGAGPPGGLSGRRGRGSPATRTPASARSRRRPRRTAPRGRRSG